MSKKTIKFTLDLLGKKQVAKSITSINLKVSPPSTKMTLKKYNPDHGKTFTKTVLTITFKEESQDSEWQPLPPKKSTKALLEYILQGPPKKATPTKFKPVTDYSDVEDDTGTSIIIEETTSLGNSDDLSN